MQTLVFLSVLFLSYNVTDGQISEMHNALHRMAAKVQRPLRNMTKPGKKR